MLARFLFLRFPIAVYIYSVFRGCFFHYKLYIYNGNIETNKHMLINTGATAAQMFLNSNNIL